MTSAETLLLPKTPAQLRDELEQLTVAHLRGPEGGEQEELPGEIQVRDYYILGMLAPRDAEAPRESADSATDDSEPGEDEEPSSAVSLFPSTLGLTFAVDPTAAEVVVDAHWGRYTKEKVKDEDKPDGTSTVWRRAPCGGSVRLALSDGEIQTIQPDPHFGDVHVSGIVREGPAGWLVTLFLVNDQQEESVRRDEQWMFQAELSVAGVEDEAVFVRQLPGALSDHDEEAGALDMLYRHHVELATGHGTSVTVTCDPADSSRARRITTVSTPHYDIPQTQAPDPEDVPELSGAEFDMSALAHSDDLGRDLYPLVSAYRAWIADRQTDLDLGSDGLAEHATAGATALDTCRQAADRIEAGIDLLVADPDAEGAFRFANTTMALQRIHTIAADIRRADPSRTLVDVTSEVDQPKNRSWRPFQLAFVLLNLASLTDPTHEERRQPGLVDLLWFPTGGGKTEAYLGLCAYTLAMRRLQGEVGGRDGSDGVGIVMRYTLRLLTAQQFQRAAALICACEVVRQRALADGDDRLGHVPFRIGLWVGFNVTPNRGAGAERAIDQSRDRGGRSRGANPVQLAMCPWCGTAITASKNAEYDTGRRRTIVYCGDKLGRCPFGRKHSKDEGLPVVTVDEELYRLLPGLIIATADKFAQLPWQGQLTALFGGVTQRCERHGYRSPDLDHLIDENDSHRARKPLPPAKTVSTLPLRPPDLIIQDELHLMTGPLGSLAGLYETAVDELCTWTVGQHTVRPKVVASTATVRRANQQARALFDRDLKVFPPQGLDVTDSFFARQVPTSPEAPGRRYLGICAHGRRLKAVEIRVYVALMGAAQYLFERHGMAADPWMTLVGYFSSLRDLGGMRRMVDDDVKSRLSKVDHRGLGRRQKNDVAELTSRMDSSQIPVTLDRLGIKFDPNRDNTGGYPIDVLLATNMISVGVDVPRLGLMVVAGQPKATAEYIQATSRVGRSQDGPGLVLTISNWTRPRDLSHYERFEHYHATFYRHVEATTLTPFAPRAVDRGLTALLVGLIRHRQPDWNANDSVKQIDVDDDIINDIVAVIARRAESVTGSIEMAQDLKRELEERLKALSARQARQSTGVLGYKERNDGQTTGLLHPPNTGNWDLWTCPNSLREVEPGINLMFDDTDYSFLEPAYTYASDLSADEDRDAAESGANAPDETQASVDPSGTT